ncbi:MAG: hypothetical protein OXP28_04465 [Gammaproteobacteria bacterium]|nr:hypothetical protein [Gammaproteobacteria bacterium]MDE0224372.1 hypothetical protein [Gammaproteobacteria bacterium]
MTRNLVLVFAGIFSTTAALDIWTTWVGVVQMGYPETNPYSDTSSIQALAIPEVITLFLGMSLVALGAHFAREALETRENGTFADFKKNLFTVRNLVFATFILVPFVLAILRIVAILSNTLVIVTGWSLFNNEEFSHLSWNQFVLTVFGVAFAMPTVYLVYRVCRASAPHSPDGGLYPE